MEKRAKVKQSPKICPQCKVANTQAHQEGVLHNHYQAIVDRLPNMKDEEIARQVGLRPILPASLRPARRIRKRKIATRTFATTRSPTPIRPVWTGHASMIPFATTLAHGGILSGVTAAFRVGSVAAAAVAAEEYHDPSLGPFSH